MVRPAVLSLAFMIAALPAAPINAQESVSSVARWQYSTLEGSRSGQVYIEGTTAKAYTRYCIGIENGCAWEAVILEEPAPSGDEKYSWIQRVNLATRATAKALALLGKDGWELVSVLPETEGAPPKFYLKRRLK